jgi:protein-disulfide isomerase/uncharacterized membrane protein
VRSAVWLFLVRLAALVALLAAAALYVDYTSGSPTYCGVESGCAAVRGSGFGYVPLFGSYVPVPLFGLIGFGAILVLSLYKTLARWLLVAAVLGALVALALLALQATRIGRFCLLCVAADGAALVAGTCAILLAIGERKRAARADFGVRASAWPIFGVLAVAAPMLWPRVRPLAPIADAVRRMYVPGKINVVEFSDFQCPYCRMLAPRLKAVIANYASKVHFLRLNFPLDGHAYAYDAARAEVCARQQGRSEAMADALFAAGDLTPAANRRAAEALGLELAVYDRCISSGAANKVIEAEAKILLDAGLLGLPTTYVGARRILGAQPEEVFRDAFERALEGDGEGGVPAWAYVLGVLGISGALAWSLRLRHANIPHGNS